jgi:Family of unknown function (DUF6502)
LVQRAYLPRGAADKLEHLGSDVADLIDTIDHNVERGAADPRFQRRVIYHDVPAAVAAEFRALSGKQAMALLVKLDRWLAAQEAENATTPPTAQPRLRLGMGIYYFEQGPAPSSTPKD